MDVETTVHLVIDGIAKILAKHCYNRSRKTETDCIHRAYRRFPDWE
jgi:hypothetical protein